MEYREKIEELINEIIRTDGDIVIVGDNSSGKTDVLKGTVEKLKDEGKTYYIDACNRIFKYENTLDTEVNPPTTNEVLELRLKDENFNLKDTFGNSGVIEKFFNKYKSKFLSLVNEFLEKNIEIGIDQTGVTPKIVLKVNGEIYEYLSNGYQAIFRIFLELIYATDVNRNLENIVIDEITEFLSIKNEARILVFLREKFPGIRFIVSTHSEDIISNTPNCRLVVIREDNYEILDGDDFQTNTDIRRVFNNLFFKGDSDKEKSDIESQLRNLYNKKIFENWNENDDLEIEKLERQDLTNSQRLLLKDIKEF